MRVRSNITLEAEWTEDAKNQRNRVEKSVRFLFLLISSLYAALDLEVAEGLPMKNKENETYELFQLKDTAECRNLMFLSFDHLSRLGVPVRGSHYNKVSSGTLKSGENLDRIYERFNLYHPDDFRGHSLSVSDVIVLHKDNRDLAYYYVDSFGFRQVPEFFGV